MNDVVLKVSTGVQAVDDTLASIVTAFEQTFPGRIRAYYLIGSYAQRTAVPLSDIDGFVIFARHFETPCEQTLAQHIAHQCALSSPVRLDVGPCSESDLAQLPPVIQVALKLGSRLVYGADIRETLPMPTFPMYTTAVMASAHQFIARLRKQTQLTTTHVDYPDIHDEFFGYTRKSIAAWYPPTVDAGTKELVATVSRIATAIVVRQTQQHVAGKQQAINLYQQHIGGKWAPFVAQTFECCKLEWKYLVPKTGHARHELRQLCQRMLTFEREFLQLYGLS